MEKSLFRRGLVAVWLTIGFYLLALAIAAGLLLICYGMLRYAERVPVKLVLLCLGGALVILYAIFPRLDRFRRPGPRLEPASDPLLFARIQAVAEALGQQMPREVYLVPDFNAWVAHRGGFLGIGSRRVMGLGLPLLSVVTPRELDGILAHEFGHYQGGDTRLGLWIYKTRSAIGRTLSELGDGLLQVPFRLYAGAFLRITQGISRAQEFAADRIAASLVGPEAMASGLIKVSAQAPLFEHFRQGFWHPVLAAGYVPSLVEGYSAYASTAFGIETLGTLRSESLAEGPADRYDSHPSLRQRLEAIGVQAEAPAATDPRQESALALLADPGASENSLLAFLFAGRQVGPRPLSWAEVPQTVLLPQWRRVAREVAEILGSCRLDELPARLEQEGGRLAAAMGGTVNERVERVRWPELLTPHVARLLAVSLHDAGWNLAAAPGEPVVASLGERRFEPFTLADAVLHGGERLREWDQAVASCGCGRLELGVPEGAQQEYAEA